MKTTRLLRTGIFPALLVAVVSLLGTVKASAQCSTFSVINNVGVQLKVYLYDAAANRYGIAAPAGTSSGWGPPPVGVESTAGNIRQLNPCSPCLTLTASGLAGNFCVTVCYDAATCTLKIDPCNAPCLP